jgi:hypothetical protein
MSEEVFCDRRSKFGCDRFQKTDEFACVRAALNFSRKDAQRRGFPVLAGQVGYFLTCSKK